MTEQDYDPERGAALITVLFVISICAVVAMAMLSRQAVDVESAASLTVQAQAYQYALGAEDLARQMLASDAALTPGIDFPGQAWAKLREGFPVAGGIILIQIEDLQGRFNINTLAGGRDLPLQRFERLLDLLNIDSKVGIAVADRMGTRDRPVLLHDINDLRSLDELNADDFAKLRPFITALPDALTLLNVNTASAVVLKAYIPDDKNYGHMIERLQQKGYLSQPDLNAIGMTTDGIGAASDYFAMRAIVQLHGRITTLRSVLRRDQDASGAVTMTILSRDLSHDD